ncbi:DUF2188 domain-containing protein [Amycolatopsis sp. lyj-23]|uniref:DUF2188 domain-containing protein n=1 Tax=Amycolatopsis sp. lyj-23 TaxID=2789283 RepID=UPI003978911D
MVEGDVHTYFEEGHWKNRVEGGVRASNTSLHRVDSVLTGRQTAKKRRVSHFIHDCDGGIESEKSFRPRTSRR